MCLSLHVSGVLEGPVRTLRLELPKIVLFTSTKQVVFVCQFTRVHKN